MLTIEVNIMKLQNLQPKNSWLRQSKEKVWCTNIETQTADTVDKRYQTQQKFVKESSPKIAQKVSHIGEFSSSLNSSEA